MYDSFISGCDVIVMCGDAFSTFVAMLGFWCSGVVGRTSVVGVVIDGKVCQECSPERT